MKYGSSLTAFVFAFSVMALRPTCSFFFHQPKVPNELIDYENKK